MVQELVGEFAELEIIVGPDADAHLYQLNILDAYSVATADLILVNGLNFESCSNTLISDPASHTSVHIATQRVDPLLTSGEVYLHTWNSLSNGVIYANNIADVVMAALPQHAAAIDQNRQDM